MKGVNMVVNFQQIIMLLLCAAVTGTVLYLVIKAIRKR